MIKSATRSGNAGNVADDEVREAGDWGLVIWDGGRGLEPVVDPGGVDGRDETCCGDRGRESCKCGGSADACDAGNFGGGMGIFRVKSWTTFRRKFHSVTLLTDVNKRPGSPKDERHDKSNLPSGIIVPGR